MNDKRVPLSLIKNEIASNKTEPVKRIRTKSLQPYQAISEEMETEVWDTTHTLGRLTNAVEETNRINQMLQMEINRLSDIKDELDQRKEYEKALYERYSFLKNSLENKSDNFYGAKFKFWRCFRGNTEEYYCRPVS